MTRKMIAHTYEELRENYWYDPLVGIFIRIKSRKSTDLGKIPMGKSNTYRVLYLNDEQYKQHRMAWLYAYGECPDSELDHIDRDRTNNRIDNLRVCTSAQNSQNQKFRPASDTSGYRGVRREANKYVASISVNNKTKHLGSFDTAEDAYAVRRKRGIELRGEFYFE